MKLIEYDASWKEKGYEIPEYDRERMREITRRNPAWIHFGGGNIFRAMPAAGLQKILNDGSYDKGVIVCGGHDYEVIEKVYKPYDDLCLYVELKADGTVNKKVIGSVAQTVVADSYYEHEWNRLKEIFTSPSLQMASFTITEKGYSLTNLQGGYVDAARKDFSAGLSHPGHLMGKVTALLYERYLSGKKIGRCLPVALVSMDNCSHNGDRLYASVRTYAENWSRAGFIEADFLDYLGDVCKVSFPWTMIDKITPRPDEKVRQLLLKDGFEDAGLIVTGSNTFAAAFVNAEEAEYLVIEDSFPNGRPPLEKAGYLFTDRQTVDKAEKMKVCTCLNPLHTALAIFGCLLSYRAIWEEMKDPELNRLVHKIGYEEGMPVVVNPGVLDPEEFIRTVLTRRFPNPFLPDTPQRIATDTSQKLPVRYGETIKAYLTDADLKAEELVYIPLTIAGWCRYLMGIDDSGTPFTPSPDPLLHELQAFVKDIPLGGTLPDKACLSPILSNDKIFAVNLYEAGLGEKIEGMFAELTAGKGAVRATLKKYLS